MALNENNLYIYVSSSFELKERLTGAVRATSVQVNTIYVYTENTTDFTTATLRFYKSTDKINLKEIEVNGVADLIMTEETSTIPDTYFFRNDALYFEQGKEYNFWKLTIPNEILQNAGTYACYVNFRTTTQSVASTLFTFEVEGGAIITNNPITIDEYNYLLAFVSTYNTENWQTQLDAIEEEVSSLKEDVENLETNVSTNLNSCLVSIDNTATASGVITLYATNVKGTQTKIRSDIVSKTYVDNLTTTASLSQIDALFDEE